MNSPTSAPLLVADSGPLIALARVSLLPLPARLYGQVLVPAPVWDEVIRRPSELERAGLQAAVAGGDLVVSMDAPDPPLSVLDPALGMGERAAIAMAKARGAAVLIDERRGRRVAAAAGLAVVGTLGLLLRGRELGLIGPVRPTLEFLQASGYHLSDALTARVLALLGE